MLSMRFFSKNLKRQSTFNKLFELTTLLIYPRRWLNWEHLEWIRTQDIMGKFWQQEGWRKVYLDPTECGRRKRIYSWCSSIPKDSLIARISGRSHYLSGSQFSLENEVIPGEDFSVSAVRNSKCVPFLKADIVSPRFTCPLSIWLRTFFSWLRMIWGVRQTLSSCATSDCPTYQGQSHPCPILHKCHAGLKSWEHYQYPGLCWVLSSASTPCFLYYHWKGFLKVLIKAAACWKTAS